MGGISDINNMDKIEGATDGTPIGNIGDALKVAVGEGVNLETNSANNLRIAEQTVLFEANFINSTLPLLFSSKLVGAGTTITRNANISSMVLSIDGTASSRAVYQSKEYFRYIPGQVFTIKFVGRFAEHQTGMIQYLGYMDDQNGIAMVYSDSGLGFLIRSNTSGSVVDTIAYSGDYNGDPLTGYNYQKQTLYQISFEWLSTGTIEYAVRIGKDIIFAHRVGNSNVNDVPYMRTANLPFRAEILQASGTGSAKALNFTCFSVISEGKAELAPSNHSGGTRQAVRDFGTGAFFPIISARLKSDFLRAQLVLRAISVLATSNTDVIVEIRLNPTLTGASFASQQTNAIFEVDTSATAFSSPGEILDTIYISKSGGESASLSDTFLKVVADIDGNRDIISLAVRSLGSNASAAASMTFSEFY